MLSHISFGEGVKTLAILIPTKDFTATLIDQHYVQPLVQLGFKSEEIIAFNLGLNNKGKAPVTTIVKPWLENLGKALTNLNIKSILICEPTYFKTICKQRKAEPHYGYAIDTIWTGITGFICTNYRALFFNPANQGKIDMALKAVLAHTNHTQGLFDKKILKHCHYPQTYAKVRDALDSVISESALSCDIEAYSLKVDKANVATICFATDQHSGFAFQVGNNRAIRAALKKFFEEYQGTLIFHGSPYDCKVIIWELFMSHPRDYAGMLHGLHVMFRNLEDTKIIAYLALNSTAGISLGLKDLAFEFAGNWGVDVTDITKIPMDKLLEYNMIDGVATWYVHDMYRDIVRKEQEDVYQELFLPALKVLTQMELCGIPMNLGEVLNAEHKMDDIVREHFNAVMRNPIIIHFTHLLRDLEAKKANAKLKKLRKYREDFLHVDFNPNSDVQLRLLLHDHLGLPVLEKTDKGSPSTKASVLRSLSLRIKNSRKWSGKGYETLIDHIVELHEVSKILNTFIPAFKNNTILKDGWNYLHGSFNLGGTKSGRLSSSDPNLMNTPSTGTKYAKPVKGCFQAPPLESIEDMGWIHVGADFFSLEDKVSALLTNDPNKLAIYTDGYDGHCLRAYKYFGDQMPDIIPDNVKSINSIKTKYPDLRQLSKSPTFLLTYMGTWRGLMKQFGFTTIVAQKIEQDYHDLYKVSDDWVMDKIREAGKTGFVELAFGLKLRTPILPQVVIDSQSLPYAAQKEIKTAGNALGQSYGLLNTRAANDSQYYMIRNTLQCLKWVNDNLIECMEWNKLAPIQHPTITLGAELEIYYPSWATPITVPNQQSIDQLRTLLSGSAV